MRTDDTIVAISSAMGVNAARIIIRLSGSESHRIATCVCGDLPLAQSVSVRRFRLREPFSTSGQIYAFASPRSATGEDIIEFHLPGNILLARLLLDELIAQGARQAEPGEFTARAFFNGRIDLTEAEGIAATIAAHSEAELSAARRLMSGELSRRLAPFMESLANTLALIEAEIDFSEEPVSFLPREQIVARIDSIASSLRQLLSESPQLETLSREPQIVLAGRPNAGKSTLLNALAGFDRAIVSSLAGTTRDALSATIHLPHGLARLIDIAGLGDHERDDRSAIDSLMSKAAIRAVESADVVLLVRDITDTRPPIALPTEPDLIVRSKADLSCGPDRGIGDELPISANTGEGLCTLVTQLDELCFARPGSDGAASAIALSARHVRAIEEATRALSRAGRAIDLGAELLALELREALDALGSILGQITPDDVLGKIFASFCIGK